MSTSEEFIAFLNNAWLFLQSCDDLFYRMIAWIWQILCNFGFFLEYLWTNYEAFILNIAQDPNLKWKVAGTLLWSLIFITYYRMKK